MKRLEDVGRPAPGLGVPARAASLADDVVGDGLVSWGTIAYGMAAGVSVSIAVLFAAIGARRAAFQPMDLALTALGLCSAAASLATLHLQSADDAGSYEVSLQSWFSLSGLAFIVAVVWVVAVASGSASRRIPLLLTVGAVVVAVVNALTPTGLIVDSVTGLRGVTLFGESFVVHEPNRSPWRLVLDLYLIGVGTYVAAVIVTSWRRSGRHLEPLLAGLGVLAAAGVYDSFVDEGVVNTSYLAPFGVLGLLVGLAIQHATEIVGTQRELAEQSAELEGLVASRTESLREANARVVDEFRRQQQTTRRMARLTSRFVELSDVAASPAELSALAGALSGAVGAIGEAVEASAIQLSYLEASTGQMQRVEWVAGPTDETGDPGPPEVERALRVGSESLGSITIGSRLRGGFSDDQQRVVDLSLEYLSNLLHRTQLVQLVIEQSVDEERRRIARELHDSMSQRLYAAAFNAEALSVAATDDGDFAAAQARKIHRLILESLAEMRTLLFELNPKALEGASLTGLVSSLAASMESIYGQEVDVEVETGPALPAGPKLALYRIAQESLGNALRHATATHVAVSVSVDDQGATLVVTDDGVGFDVDSISVGHGLRNIEARAAEINADLDLSSHAGRTVVAASWRRPLLTPPRRPSDDLRSEPAGTP